MMDYINETKSVSYNNVRYINNRYNTHNSKYNFSSIYEYFSTDYGIAFFSTRREEHYQILNDTVFRALNTIDSKIEVFDKYEIYNIESIIFSTVYKNAKRHLKKDNPQLVDKVEKLYEDVKKYNLKVIELDELIDKTIKDSFRKSQDPVSKDSYQIYDDSVKTVALIIWNNGLDNTKKDQDINNFEKHIDIERHLIKTNNNPVELYLNNHFIGKGKDENEINKIHEIMKKDILKNNNIICKIISVLENKLILEELFKDIKSNIVYICNDIDKKVYSTNVKCCPNVWRSLWESFRLPF